MLSEIANHLGTNPEQLVKSTALYLIEEEQRFQSAVSLGIEQADRGDLIDHEEVVARIERRIQAR